MGPSMIDVLPLVIVLLAQSPPQAIREGDSVETQPSEAPSDTFEGIFIRIPRPITPTQFSRYCALLELSAAQQAYADVCFERHRKRLKDIERAWAGTLRSAWEPLHNPGPSTAGLESAYLETMRIRDLVDDELATADQAFLAEIESFLSDGQRELLPRVKLHRSRDRSPLLDNRIYESTIDLTAIVEQRGLDEEQTAAVDPVLWEYERTVTPLGSV